MSSPAGPAAPAPPAPPAQASSLTPAERAIVWVIAAVQFVNILDFVIIMPMGPDFARALGFPESQNGYVAGAYTGAAALSGLVGSFFLDRFDRRPALVTALVGLALGTAACTLAWDLHSLMAARCLAGLFGGPATSLAFSIIADVVPNQRRGQAMGLVMGAFGAASVLGVPAGLVLAENISWRAPFVAVALVGFGVAAWALVQLPSLRGHLDEATRRARTSLATMLADPLVWISYLMTFIVMGSGFAVIPNISAHLQHTVGLARADLWQIYFVGGLVSVAVTPQIGKLVDRFGSLRVGSVGSLLLMGVLFAVFYHWVGGPILVWMSGFFTAMAFRNVSYNTLASKVPRPEFRARFMSLQSFVQHAASTAGGFVSAAILSTEPDGTLIHMDRVALLAMGVTALIPLLLFVVESGVRRRSAPATTLPRAVAEG